MKKTFCDICGKEITKEELFEAHFDESEMFKTAAHQACPSVKDLCPKCFRLGMDINPEPIIKKIWVEKAKNMC